MSFSLCNTTRTKPPTIPFKTIADEVLGPSFEVSLVIVGDTKARRLNSEHRQKSYIPNVLSFPLSTTSGEIFLNLNQAKKQASDYGMSYRDFIIYLFIHSLLHLKGYDHGSTMEHKERYFVKRFVNNNGKNHRMRN